MQRAFSCHYFCRVDTINSVTSCFAHGAVSKQEVNLINTVSVTGCLMNKQIIAAVLALPLALSSAFAQEAEGPTVKISGFGTGALTWSNTDQAEFGRPNQASGAKKSPRTGVDSNLGLQADVGVNSWLSFTAQGLVRARRRRRLRRGTGLGLRQSQDQRSLQRARWPHRPAGLHDFGLPQRRLRQHLPASAGRDVLASAIQRPRRHRRHLAAKLRRHQRHRPAGLRPHRSADRRRHNRQEQAMSALNVVAEHGPFTARFGRVDRQCRSPVRPA